MPFTAAALLAQPDDHAAGRRLFQRSCTGCHGENAKGGRAPDLTSGNFRWGGADADLIRVIQKGIPGTLMPPCPMPDDEARAIVAYLRSLKAAGPEEKISGDAESGRGLFFGAAQCSRCHMYAGEGGRLGPDLTAIRGERKPAELRAAILDPSQSLRPGFETAEVKFADGRSVRGVRKNDDTFSIQIMDANEKLHLLLKKDLKQVDKPHVSMMPNTKLPGPQVEDLIAFLATARASDGGSAWKPAPDFNVSFDRLKNAANEPQNWLTYWGDLRGRHYSGLASITPANVASLASKWSYQFAGTGVEVTPIVVDGLMFVTGPLNNAAALDARTGRPIWKYTRSIPEVHSHCTVMTNRGFAVLGDRLYMATLDAHLVALDAKTGNVIFDVVVDDYKKGFSITHAPLAIDGKIIVGVTAGECALTGFVDAFDAATGKKLWRTWTIAQEGDPARKSSWSGNSAEFGGGPTWMTGTYDSETDTLYWTTGNPSPDYDGSVREGDNLYTCSVLALDPKTGRMKWYFQFTPHDVHDWDANETPVLIDAVFRGKPRKLMIQANRNAFFYVLDRTTGEFLLGKPFAKQTWAKGLDDKGRPIVLPNTTPTPEGNYVCPDAAGGTNWASPSYDPRTKLFYVAVREACAVYTSSTKPPRPGEPYVGTGQQEDPKVGGPGAIRAIDPLTGNIKWSYPLHTGSWSAGVLATAGGVVFGASKDGNLVAVDSLTGKLLWHYQTGAEILSSPISYRVDGRQYVAIAANSVLLTFGLP